MSVGTGIEPYLILALAALLAGLLDAVAGGGGLIQIPALFGVYPQATPATLFGTNKLASICGTGIAARTFWKTVPLDFAVLLPATGSALLFSFVGAWAMSIVPPEIFRKVLPLILALVAIHVFRNKDFGAEAGEGGRDQASPGRSGHPGGEGRRVQPMVDHGHQVGVEGGGLCRGRWCA